MHAAMRPAAAKAVPDAALVAALAERIARDTVVVGIIGLGYVGLPLARTFAAKGVRVVGFDIDPAKVTLLNSGGSYIHHIPPADIAAMVDAGRFRATADYAEIRSVDAIIICVPTPLTRHREPDLSFIRQTGEQIAPHLKAGQLVVLESSTYPGTTTEVLKPILESRAGLVSGRDLFLAYSPEREDPGNPKFATAGIPKIVGGDGAAARDLASALYDRIIVRTVSVSSTETAEAVKLTENIFRAVNIALVNELKMIFTRMGIDVWEVIEAAKTKPFGYMPFYPGPGLGGHCIPIDPFYLTWKAREYELPTRFIELAGEINTAMPLYVVECLTAALGARSRKAINGARILLLGLAYKKNVDDMRESPSLKLIELLEARGAMVAYYDSFIPVIPASREHAALAGRRSVVWNPPDFAGYDAAMIVTDHSAVDYQALLDHAPLVIDTRNATHGLQDRRAVVVKA